MELFKLSCKFDGLSGRFKNKVLSTRGDGEIGEDISDKINLINFISNKNEYDGEILISNENFEKYFLSGIIKKENGELYKNSRNATSGIINRKEMIDLPEKIIDFIDFDYSCIITNIDDIEEDLSKLKSSLFFINYPCDGIVIKLKDEEFGKSLGYTSHHWKHSIALKFDNEQSESKILDVEFSMAKETIGMVAILEPIEINGVTVKRASLHNLDIIDSLGLMIGDRVLIERAGDVIPKIVEKLEDGEDRRPISLKLCPSCLFEVEIDGPFYVCNNWYCPDKIINKIHSAAKDLKIKGIARAAIEKLYKLGYVKDINDLLEVNRDQLRMVEGFKKKSIDNFLNEIIRILKSKVTDDQLFAALNIEGFGRSIYKKIFKQLSPDEFLTAIKNQDGEKLMGIDGIGEKRVGLVVKGVVRNQKLLNDLKKKFVISEVEKKNEKGTIAFTGKGFAGRNELEDLAIKNGFEPLKTVTKELNILVCEDPKSGSSKIKKAIKYGTKVISYNEFKGMLK